MACPDYRLYGTEYSFSGQQAYQAIGFPVAAGGSSRLSSCGIRFLSDTGDGYVTQAPDFTFTINKLSGYQLEFRVESECDAVLVINTGDANWYYDDDDAGNIDPQIRLTRPSEGIYDVWIGTYDGKTCSARLIVETF
ncbi:hypothetical protein JJJ17_18875 [Paracoccus caeni]|uniref:Peptidase S1 n=2 Tax=Paracoccus caeni TaxID=657651 RepID=A0A934W0E3_9RHOB|nr:hypothetical protein [Paracoccus caeni]